MDFTGKLILIGTIEQFRATSGKDIVTRDIVLTTDEQFPKTACFTLRNELAENFAHNIGETIHLKFDINARPNRDGTRYFNQLTAWRIN